MTNDQLTPSEPSRHPADNNASVIRGALTAAPRAGRIFYRVVVTTMAANATNRFESCREYDVREYLDLPVNKSGLKILQSKSSQQFIRFLQ